MAVTIEQFTGLVEEIAPRGLACDWDNTGLLLRCGDSVSKVLVCLDATDAVAEEAISGGCDMVLSHHPLIFRPVQSLDYAQPMQGVVMKLVKNGISLYSAHTSFDIADGGMNDVLAAQLGLKAVLPVGEEGIIRVGSLPQPCTGAELIHRVKAALGIAHVRATRDFKGAISRVAVVGGSGGEYAAEAMKAGAQALVTGEAKHHEMIEAQALGVLLIEAGHFETERCFVDTIFDRLQSRANALQYHLGLKRAECMQAPSEIM
jgi:dinuclear metal center YbgI/SA1388 family protein